MRAWHRSARDSEGVIAVGRSIVRLANCLRPASELPELEDFPNVDKLNYTYFEGSTQSIIVLIDKQTAEIKSYFVR